MYSNYSKAWDSPFWAGEVIVSSHVLYVLSDITSISRPNKQAKPTFTALAITKKTILVRDKTNWYKFETSYNQQRLLPHLNTPPPKGPAGTQEALRCRLETPPHSGADHSCARRDPTRKQLTPGTTASGSTPHFLFGSWWRRSDFSPSPLFFLLCSCL